MGLRLDALPSTDLLISAKMWLRNITLSHRQSWEDALILLKLAAAQLLLLVGR